MTHHGEYDSADILLKSTPVVAHNEISVLVQTLLSLKSSLEDW